MSDTRLTHKPQDTDKFIESFKSISTNINAVQTIIDERLALSVEALVMISKVNDTVANICKNSATILSDVSAKSSVRDLEEGAKKLQQYNQFCTVWIQSVKKLLAINEANIKVAITGCRDVLKKQKSDMDSVKRTMDMFQQVNKLDEMYKFVTKSYDTVSSSLSIAETSLASEKIAAVKAIIKSVDQTKLAAFLTEAMKVMAQIKTKLQLSQPTPSIAGSSHSLLTTKSDTSTSEPANKGSSLKMK